MAAGAPPPPAPERSAIVTGASRGIGRAIAAALLREGYSVLLVAHDPDRLTRTERELAAAGGRVHSLALDLADPDSASEIRSAAIGFHGVPEVVVPNAGVALARRLDRTDAADVERQLAVNLLAPIRLTHALLPDLLARGRGHFVFLGSGAADFPPPRLASYSTTKAGLRAFGLALDLETRRRGVRASVLEPIFVRTDLGRRPEDTEAPLERLARRHRWAVLEPEVVARALLHTLRHPRPRVPVPAYWAVPRALALAGRPWVHRVLEVPPPDDRSPEPPTWSPERGTRPRD